MDAAARAAARSDTADVDSDPQQPPDGQQVAVDAQRGVVEAPGVAGSPVRPSPRPSRLPPARPPLDYRDASSGEDSLHLSREETPENDALLPDEPSTVLASRIMRAHDNPSPPPVLAPGKDGQLPFPGVFVPPSPFRPINLLERLDHPSDPLHRLGNSALNPGLTESGVASPHGPTPDSCSPLVTSVPKCTSHEDLASVDTILLSSAQCAVDDIPSRPTQDVCDPADTADNVKLDPPQQPVAGLHNQSINMTNPLGCDPTSPSSTQAVVSLVKPFVSPTLATDPVFSGGKDSSGKETLPVHNAKCTTTTTNGAHFDSHQGLKSLSPHSTNMLPGPSLPSSVVPSIGQTKLPVESIVNHLPVTPTRTSKSSVMHPDFSRSTIQRPAVTPTLARVSSGPLKLNSPSKFSLEVDDVHRTPAQRVPIPPCGASSPQKTVPGQSQVGCVMMTRPVFTRSALDDPSRSPAKRVLVTGLVASPTKDRFQSLPTRLGPRARSASVEPRPVAPIPAHSHSVEPSVMTSKSDDHGTTKETIIPVVPLLTRSRTKLPFPLVTGQKSSNDRPPPISEEHEMGSIETNIALLRTSQGNVMSQMRQPSVNSRIPRIGNKPYARPPSKSGRGIADATTANTAHTSVRGALASQLAFRNSGVRNVKVGATSARPVNDQRVVGSLKRKRGSETTLLPKSHPVIMRQVVPGILGGKYAQKAASEVYAYSESSPRKVPQPLFRKVVDGMLSTRYTRPQVNLETTDSDSVPLSPLSELSSSSNEEVVVEKSSSALFSVRPASEESDASLVPGTHESSLLHQDVGSDEPYSRPRRTSRARKPAQQQYVLDVFNDNATAQQPPARRKHGRTEGDGFMGMSATALKALTTSNTTKNQQTVAVLATEVVRKEGLRPESPTVKARTILQKQRDERDRRRRERAQKRVQPSEEGLGTGDTEGRTDLRDPVTFHARASHDENHYNMPRRHSRGPGDEEDYETPERPERFIEPLRLEGTDRKARPVKQVKWHRGLSTAIYLDEVGSRRKALSKDVAVRGCLATTSKNLPLDPLGNLIDTGQRPSAEVVTEQVVVKRYLYDDDIEPEPIPARTTRSKSKKGRS